MVRRWSDPVEAKPSSSSPPASVNLPLIRAGRLEQGAGVALFLAVTAFWMIWTFGFDAEVPLSELAAAAGLSAVSVAITGYLVGRYEAALWLGWVPGVAMIWGLWISSLKYTSFIFGWLVLFGWAVYFLPLIALGVWLRGWRKRRFSPASPNAG